MPASVTLTLLAKPGCHLCDEARVVIGEVVAGLEGQIAVTIEEKSIVDDPALFDRYSEEIPVVLLDGRVHNIWRVDPDRLRAALLKENNA